MAYESSEQIDRRPLVPPPGYDQAAPPPGYGQAQPLAPPNANADELEAPSDENSGQAGDQPGWHESPRWAEIRRDDCIEVESDPQAPVDFKDIKRC